MNLISSRIAAHAQTRQVEASIRADAAANAVDRAIGGVWQAVVQLLRRRPAFAHAQARHIFQAILPAAQNTIDASLRRTVSWGHRTTARALTGTLSTTYLRAATLRRLAGSTQGPIREDKDRKAKHLPSRPGIIQIALDALGLKTVDLGALLREPTIAEQFSDAQQKEIFSALLFPPPTEDVVADLVYATVQGITWYQRLEAATRTSATPDDLANIVAMGFARGQSAKEIAQDLLPAVDGFRSTARRIARTESLRVAHGVQMQAWQGLGDLVTAYQLHSTLSPHSRSWHAARNGQVYPIDRTQPSDPVHGDCLVTWGYLRPPMEPADPGARPAGTPATAWNCMCHMAPVLAPDPAMLANPELMATFTNAQAELIPDPVTYHDWFQQADERQRRTAVGSRRYTAVAKAVGKPEWSHFLDERGELLALQALNAESDEARSTRISRVRQLLDRRREMVRQVQLYGFLLG